MSEYKLTFTLKQYTPLIHFQHDQAGATLRGTEVKAALDKFLIKKGNLQKEWFVGYNTSGERDDALAYKLQFVPVNEEEWKSFIEKPKSDGQGGFRQKERNGITSTETNSYPGFFGNMGKNYEYPETIKKFIFFPDGVNLSITSFHTKLNKIIEKHLPEFLATNNFGTRKTKGFGSFYLADLEKYPVSIDTWFDYKIEVPFPKIEKSKNGRYVPDYEKMFSGTSVQPGLFQKTDWFYRCLRGGINLKDRNDNSTFYFKSLLFLYAKSLGIQWEKRTIKEQFFFNDRTDRESGRLISKGFNQQRKDNPGYDLLQFESKNKKLLKDLLGLSSEESWLSYGNTITKEHKKHKVANGSEKEIQRYASPITFKPIELQPDIMTIFIRFDETGLSNMLDEKFDVKTKHGKTLTPPLSTPSNFSLDTFFQYITNNKNFDIQSHVERKFHITEEYNTLKHVFDSLTRLKPLHP